jgi:hypothetical protein
MDDDADDCAICLKALADPADQDKEEPAAAAADVETMTRLCAMPCSHIFHQHCIFQWLHRNAACPLCRHQLPTTDDDDDEEEEEEDEVSPDFWFPSVPYDEGVTTTSTLHDPEGSQDTSTEDAGPTTVARLARAARQDKVSAPVCQAFAFMGQSGLDP